jgi:predicted O-methyltransferase YrrM
MSAASIAADNSGFDRTLAAIADVDGWLTEAQARRLHDRARELGPGERVVEIGSYHGRSTIVLASALPDGGSLIAIDSHDGDNRGPRQVHGVWEEGQADLEVFRNNLRKSQVEDRVKHLRSRSDEALGMLDGGVDLLYIDGAHQFGAARRDIRSYGARVRDGGAMLVHDGFSSVGVTLALFSELAFSTRWRYSGRTGSLVEYRRVPTSRVANVRRHARSLPWFIRNVAIKLALVTRQRWAWRALGHEGERWPY